MEFQRFTSFTRIAVSMAAALALACGGLAETPAAGPTAGDSEETPVIVVGTLTDEGVECPALRDDGGELYTLTGDLKGFGPGDRVRVTGSVAQISFCMQGTTIGVESIEAAPEED